MALHKFYELFNGVQFLIAFYEAVRILLGWLKLLEACMGAPACRNQHVDRTVQPA